VTALALASYKLRFHDVHVRAVPSVGLDGEPFGGPGVDLLGDDARAAIAAAEPIVGWLRAREPGVLVRSISIRMAGPRVLVSLAVRPGDARPRALRFDPPYAEELRDAGREAERIIGEACRAALARRR
jgi:hypothetical protein